MKYKKEIICVLIGFISGCYLTNLVTTPSVRELEAAKTINVPQEDNIEVYNERTLPKKVKYTYSYNEPKTELEQLSQEREQIEKRYPIGKDSFEKQVDNIIQEVQPPKVVIKQKPVITNVPKVETKTIQVNGVKLKEKIDQPINVEIPENIYED